MLVQRHMIMYLLFCSFTHWCGKEVADSIRAWCLSVLSLYCMFSPRVQSMQVRRTGECNLAAGLSVRGVREIGDFTQRQLGWAPASPATLSAGEAVIGNGWTDVKNLSLSADTDLFRYRH